MEIDKSKVFKVEVKTVKQFAEERGVTTQSVHYAIGQDYIDHVQVGFEILIVMNKKAKEYLEGPKRADVTEKRETLGL